MTHSLFFETPLTYALSILHPFPETIHFADCREEALHFYSQLEEWVKNYCILKQQEHTENFSKAAQALRGSLSEFLSLPLRSDEEHIQKILHEHFQHFFGESNHVFCSVAGYHHIHHTNVDNRLKPYYKKELDALRKTIGKTNNPHTVLETWIEGNELSLPVRLQQHIAQSLYNNESFTSKLPSSLVRVYFRTGSKPEKEQTAWMRVKLNLQTKKLIQFNLVEAIHEEIAEYILPHFSWQLLQTSFLPAANREIFYLIDVQDKEELHRLRASIVEVIDSLKAKKVSIQTILSIGEMERIQDITA